MVVTGTLDGLHDYEYLGMTDGTTIYHAVPVVTYMSTVYSGINLDTQLDS